MTIINMVGGSASESKNGFVGIVSRTLTETSYSGCAVVSGRGDFTSTVSTSSVEFVNLTRMPLTIGDRDNVQWSKFGDNYVFNRQTSPKTLSICRYTGDLSINRSSITIDGAPVDSGSGKVTGGFAVVGYSSPAGFGPSAFNFSQTTFEFPATIDAGIFTIDISSVNGKTYEELYGVTSTTAHVVSTDSTYVYLMFILFGFTPDE